MLDLSSRYLNMQVTYLFIISVIIMMLFSFLRMTLSGMYLFQLWTITHVMIRNLMFLCGGYFLESGITELGLKETLDTLTDY